MKKLFLLGLLFIIIGYLLGNYIFNTKIDFSRNNNSQTYYFIIDKSTNNYLAITKDIEVVERLQEIYQSQKVKVSVVEKNLSSKELNNNINQFDSLIKSSEKIEDILTIEKVVLANYQKIRSKN